MNASLLLLAVCQALLLINNITFIAINGLVGLALAPVGWMATLPITGYVVGAALSALPVARLQARWGRQRTFQLGLAVAFISAGLCAWAVYEQSFWGLVAATVFAGFYSANGALYRFAGPELVDVSHRERALSWVLAGGVAGAFLGPELATLSRDWVPVPFVGAYLALMGVALVGGGIMTFIKFPPVSAPKADAPPGRTLRELARQPDYLVAVAAAALGYGIMNLLMASTPIAMQQCQLPFASAAWVLKWHVLGMYVPSFFTGHLIQRFGPRPIMLVGALLNLACVAVALSGIDLMHFLVALTALGVGWNFLYTGASSLLTRTYRPEEKTLAQGGMDSAVFWTMALSSFSSGALITTQGWTWLNWGSLLPIGLVLLALLIRRRTRVAMAI